MFSVISAIGYGMVRIPVFAARIIMIFLTGLSAAIANMFLALPAMPTAVRRYSAATDGEFSMWKLGTVLGFFLAAAGLIVTPFIAGIERTGDNAGNIYPTKIISIISQHVPFAGYILIGFLTSNFLSLCYELGRKKTGEAEKPTESEEKKDDGVSDFGTMYDSIRSFDSLAPEQARELYRRIVELTGERKITPDEAKKLCAIVENGARAHIES